MESATHSAKLTSHTSTAKKSQGSSPEQMSDSQCNEIAGAKNSRQSMLTYEDIFYRKVSPQRERERMAARTESQRKRQDAWIPDATGSMVQLRPQTSRIVEFTDFQGSGINRETTVVYRRTQSIQTRKPFSDERRDKAQKINIVHYVGIAADEPKRIAKHIGKKDMILPLVQIGWDEALCGLEATYLDMLSPSYTTSMRDGCWFCHNQGVGQLRDLRHNYPDLWALLMKWDTDSPVTFHADGHTVHDFDRRFQLEDDGIINPDEKFRWAMLENQQLRFF